MFLHPLGLLALFAVPVVVGLHLFRRRFRPRPVSALFLWTDEDRVALSGRRRERLRTSASFWLEVLAALLFGLTLGGPRACGAGEADHLVCVLDASASMGAVTAGGPRREIALEALRARIDRLGPRARVTIIASGSRPRLLAGPAAFPAEARTRLADYTPSAARHELSTAVGLGRELAGEGALVLVTDRFETDAWPPEVELVAIGEASANTAITHAARYRRSDGSEVLSVTVSTFAGESSEVVVRVRASAARPEAWATGQRVTVAPGAREHLTFELPPETGTVEVVLPDDALAIDNTAFLAPAPERTVLLASTLEPDQAVQLGWSTSSAPSVPHLQNVLPDTALAGPERRPHLLFARDPRAVRGTSTLSLARLGAERVDLIGPFLLERRLPLLDGITLEGVVWSADPELTLSGVPLVSAGNLALVTETLVGGDRAIRLNLDPKRSSLTRSPDWPVFLTNLVNLRRDELPGSTRTNVAIGEAFEYRRANDLEPESTYVLEDLARGERRELRARDVLVVDDFEAPGRFRLWGSDGRPLEEIAVRFEDARESDLLGARSGQRPATGAAASVRAGTSRLQTVLLVVITALILCDWMVLRRSTRPAVRERGA